MVFEGPGGPALVRICIAVYAAVGAGVISADIGTFRAAALVPCGFCFIRKAFREKQVLNSPAVDTMCLFDFIADQVIAAAGKHTDSITFGDGRQFVCHLDLEISAAIKDFQAVRLFKFGKVANDFAVPDHKAEVTALNVSCQLGGKLFEGPDVKIAVGNARNNDWVETPVYMLRRVGFAQVLEAFNGCLLFHIAFKNRWDAGNGIVKIEFMAHSFHFPEVIKEGSEILGPEHKTYYVFRL